MMLLCLLLSFPGKYNEVLSPGDPAPAWPALEGVDGRKYTMETWKNQPYLVVVFTCNSCPCARDYEDRIKSLAEKYSKKLAVVAINSSLQPADNLQAMKKRAEERGFNFTYLFDDSQKVARAYGATYTPEFFLLNQERKVIYMGALDDKDDPDKVTTRYLEQALAAAEAGMHIEKSETLARGCMIRYKRQK